MIPQVARQMRRGDDLSGEIRIAERTALTALPRFGFSPVRTGQAGVLEENDIPTHHVEVPRSRLDASVSQLASVGWAVEVSGRRYRPAGNVAWNVNSGIDWFELSGSIDFGGVTADMPELLAALARGDRAVDLEDGSRGILPAGLCDAARAATGACSAERRSSSVWSYAGGVT